MRRLMFLLLLGLCAPLACAQADDALLRNVLATLAQHAAVRADFTQTRSNPALAKPQLSRGQLLFVLGRGMLWQTQTPFAETLAFAGKQAARIDPQGQSHPLRDARGVSQISQMLQAMLAGHADAVRRQFHIAASGNAAQWTLRLVPRQERMAHVLGSIELRGDAYLEGIRITMRDGGDTDIRFSQTRDAGALSSLEKRALGLP